MRRRTAIQLSTWGVVALFSLACNCGPTDPTDDVCSSAATEASLSDFEVLGGWTTGGQGADMLVVTYRWRGDDVPGCARVTYEVEAVETGETLASNTLDIETNDRGTGWRTGSVYLIRDPDRDECRVRITATSYGLSAEHMDSGNSFRCTRELDAGPDQDAAPGADGG